MSTVRMDGGHRFRLSHGPSETLRELPAPETIGVAPWGLTSIKPRLDVRQGDRVKCGQVVFHHKRDPRIKFVSPVAGSVREIRFGPRRRLDAVVIEPAAESDGDAVDFGALTMDEIGGLAEEEVRRRLLDAGLWPRLRSFPGWDLAPLPPDPEATTVEHDETPGHPPRRIAALFVACLATEPHTVKPEIALGDEHEAFRAGLEGLRQLAPACYLVSTPKSRFPKNLLAAPGYRAVTIEDKYPAENLGVHVYAFHRLGPDEVALGVGVEEVLDLGHLLLHGRLRSRRTYGVAGNGAREACHMRGLKGLKIADLTGYDEKGVEDVRFVAGGLFTGERRDRKDYLGILDTSVNVLVEDRRRIPFVFFRLGTDRLTLSRAYLGGFRQDAERDLSTSNNGEERACIQCGYCIDVCPVDLMPNLVFKAALTGDIEKMEYVGIHDCVDCGLCTFVCPSKIELGQHIADGKALIAKEG